ncbi:MAG: XRE family transcriptional regulator [Desulfurellales bacterium]|nr:MAG: XRE family transcriptional regulator [Desulfurellales bacterium]
MMVLDKNKIRHLMIDAGYERFIDLADKAGVSQTTLFTAMDSDRWRPQTVERLAKALNCSPFDLITIRTETNP